MTTLFKFQSTGVKIIVRMHSLKKECVPALYSIQVTPKLKNAGWYETTTFYDYFAEVRNRFLELVTFWV